MKIAAAEANLVTLKANAVKANDDFLLALSQEKDLQEIFAHERTEV